ncbi:replication initiation protein [Vibrio parahaemolyticus]|nr:replication initiation protein [Vibrio parahaemolyticus]
MQLERFTERVLKHLPNKPYCSDDKTARLIRTKRYALKEPYIQINQPSMCAWLIFDIDEPFMGEYAWEIHGLPPPNYIAFSRDSRKYHMGYAVTPVCTTENARLKPLRYLAAIQRTYTRLLNADEGFAHLVTKNPLHSDWLVHVFHNHEYSLGELHDAVGELDKKKIDASDSELIGYERNVELFDALRYHAYNMIESVRQGQFTSESWRNYLTDHANALNQKYFTNAVSVDGAFKGLLTDGDCRSIAKSVSKWTWRNQSSIRSRIRKMQLDKSQPLETRQALGAHYAATVKANATQAKIQEAVDSLLAANKKATQKAVQELSGVSLRTVKTYWKQIKIDPQKRCS